MVSGASLTALAILLLVGAVAVVRSNWFREKVRLRIITEVERATGGRVEVGGFRFAWERLEAEVDSFVLHGKEPAGEPPLFRARSVRVGLRVVSILDRDIDIESLVVVEPRVRIVVYEDGSNNLPKASGGARRQDAGGEVRGAGHPAVPHRERSGRNQRAADSAGCARRESDGPAVL